MELKKPIKTTTKHKNLSQIYITGWLKESFTVRNSELFRIWSKKLKRIRFRCTG